MLSGGAAALGAIGCRISQLRRAVFVAGFWMDEAYNGRSALAFTALAGLVLTAVVLYSTSGRLKSPWSRRKRKHPLSLEQWGNLFTPDGKLCDDGIRFLKKVRSGGVEPGLRAEVWPFLLGVYDLTSTEEERNVIRSRKRKEYENLRRECGLLFKHNTKLSNLNGCDESSNEERVSQTEAMDSPNSGDVMSTKGSFSGEGEFRCNEGSEQAIGSKQIIDSKFASDSESSDSDSSEDPEMSETLNLTESMEDNDNKMTSEDLSTSKMEIQSKLSSSEDYTTWQRIIRLDALRANGEWLACSPVHSHVSDAKAHFAAEQVGLKDYDHLEPARIFHAARLVAILEAYALYDPEIGYCQGMSDLLFPLISMISEDHIAFWCFVGFMKKARHNFRLDEVGIRRQLSIVSKIIKYKDSHLYRHLEALQAEDCFFVYRMVVVLFRRELTFEQTLCLWEVMWADQAAIRAGIGKSAWNKIRQRAPPTDDLLLYAIAASVLQRRKQIIEKYSSMDEILRECNAMAGHLNVWKLLDDALGLVVTLHDRIETSL